jgi:glutamate synthase domain-containing protein 1
MPSKLKQRRLRRLRDDIAWWMAEARDWKQIALEHAAEIERLKGRVIHVVMPMMVPPAAIEGMKAKRVEHAQCLKCYEGARGDVPLAPTMIDNRVQPVVEE